MNTRRLIGSVAIVVGLAPVLTGCGSGGDSADDVPTITTRPSTPATSTPATESTSPTTTASATESSPEPTPSATQSSAPPEDPTTGPTTYDEAVARIDAVAATASTPTTTTRFSTPGDVVYCLLQSDFIGPTCELRLGAIKDPDVCANAPSDAVGRIEITPGGTATPQCNTDTIREPGAQVVRPPAVVRVTGGGVECAVESVGVTCVDRDAASGFFLTQGEYSVF